MCVVAKKEKNPMNFYDPKIKETKKKTQAIIVQLREVGDTRSEAL